MALFHSPLSFLPSSSSSLSPSILSFLPSSSSSLSPSIPVAFAPTLLRLKALALVQKQQQQKSLSLQNESFHRTRESVIVRASSSSEIDGKDESLAVPPPSTTAVSIENLPLESKERERMEQKLRMKAAKKIRLRRKRLVRKRRLRKKGRWPPSKMKKLKNV